MTIKRLFPRPYCCICFEMDQEWWVDEEGSRWDICVSCKRGEDAMVALIARVGREAALESLKNRPGGS